MKAQISIEYLSTFGWILLVVMVAILAVSQFGILDLAEELPEECYFGEQLVCINQYLDESGNLLLTLKSGFNKKITIEDIKIEGYYVDLSRCTRSSLEPGEEANVICPISESATQPGIIFEEDRKRFNVELTIQPEGTSDKIYLDGIIIANVLAEELGDRFSCTGNGGQYICDEEYECNPSDRIEIQGYIGTGYCCASACVPNRCTSPVVDGGLAGICCKTTRATPSGGIPDGSPNWAATVCKTVNNDPLLVCGATCAGGGTSSGLPPTELG